MATEARPIPSSPPQAPGGLPGLGHVLRLGLGPMEFLESLRDCGPVVRVRVGTWPMYVLTDSDLVHRLLVEDARHFGRGRVFQRLRPLFGDGLVISDGAFHRKQRRLVQPAFHQARIARYAQAMRERAQTMAASWQEGETVWVDREMRQHALSVVADTLFSSTLAEHAVAEVHRSLPTILEGMFVRAIAPNWLDKVPYSVNRRFDQAAARLRSVIDEVIAAYGNERTVREDLVSALLTSKLPDTGEVMSPEQVRDEAIAVMFAGTETTATTMAWAFHEISRHPEAEARLSAEADQEILDPASMPYTRAVIEEALRLHSPLLFTRRALADVHLGQHFIPSGAEVAYSPYALHRDPTLFPDPTAFRPERWLRSRSGLPSSRGFIPFSVGPHKCIGDTFAMTEAVITLATVSRRWQLVPVPGHTVRQRPAGMPQPNALPMTPIARHNSPRAEAAPPSAPGAPSPL
ncbi:cytochrome P450 [Streptomyces sp. NBC_01304]|uniref:cytochrome P450 n=1 Tax=Streptomyces sp. NBC_01304 TaxID=2903818 RepID=UPI002E141E8E|nr:cytochrome P450 [Streptomyces sp. NBC_01304]